jgi:F0F1-type ATP synthase assembly protein I
MRYPSKTLVKNITPVPRTMSEANRDAQYCMAIQTFKSDVKLTLDFIGGALMGFLIVGVISLACYGLYKML